MAPRWQKVARDVAGHPGRTTLVVLSVAIGVLAVGMIAGTRTLLFEGLTQSFRDSMPPSAVLHTADTFDSDFVASVEALPSVDRAEGRRRVTVRMLKDDGSYGDLELTAIQDFEAVRVRVVRPDGGAWPPGPRDLLVERSALDIVGAEIGDPLVVKAPSGKVRRMTMAGVAHDVSRAPAFLEGLPFGYVSFDALAWLGEPRGFNELDVVVADGESDADHITAVADAIADKLEASGQAVSFIWVPEPGKHPLDSIVGTVLLILESLGALSLLLSGFLVVNTVMAVLAQQLRQIGIMKAVGAKNSQITYMYLTMVVVFGVLSLFLALPLGAAGAFALSTYMAGLLNVDLRSFHMPGEVLAVQAAVAVGVPIAAALVPVVAGTRVTPREAMASYGLGRGQFGSSRLDRLLQRVAGLPAPVLLAVRNAFRRKLRSGLTILTLGFAGAIFIAVFSVRASMGATLDAVQQLWRYDVVVAFPRPYRGERAVAEALRVPGVVDAEGWGFNPVRVVHDDGTEGTTVLLFAPPADTTLLAPDVVAGRWLVPADENAVVVNTKIAAAENDLRPGDTITLTLLGQEDQWRVVGIVQAPGRESFLYVNYPYYARLTGKPGRVDSVLVVTADHGLRGEARTSAAIEAHFQQTGLRVSSVIRIAERIADAEAAFQILIALLLVMAVLLAGVGALGLTGTMSLSVIERTREIGVLRAVGASTQAIVRMVLTEALVLGAASGLMGSVVAVPMGKMLSDAVGMTFMHAPLRYTYSWAGAGLWLVVLVALTVVASALPGLRASRVSVREALAYE
ncbi:MAG: FtsX-like permease family protein [Anaerolineae bacterium]